MGRIYEALQRSSAEKEGSGPVAPEFAVREEIQGNAGSDTIDLDHARPLTVAAIPEDRLVILDRQRSLGAEKIRILATQLRKLQHQRPIRKLLITSTVKGEGKTVLSTNVAISLAKTRQRVLFIDGDGHQANAARLLGANGSPGLTDWWRSAGAMQDYLMRVNGLPLWFLPAGSLVEQPLEMLQSERLLDQVNKMSNWFDWVIIDSPPSAPLADAAAWGSLADAILLVAREGRTPRRLLEKALNSLDNNKLLGIVLNDCSDSDQHYYTNYYNLQHTHQPE